MMSCCTRIWPPVRDAQWVGVLVMSGIHLKKQGAKDAVRASCAQRWLVWIIFMADATSAETSVMLLGTMSVVVESAATLL